MKNEAQQRQQKKAEINRVINDESVEDDLYIDVNCPICNEQLSFTKHEIVSSKELICPMCDAEIDASSFM